VTPETLPVDDEFRLRPCAGEADVDLTSRSGSQGERYQIERRTPDGAWLTVGDVTLSPDTLSIVVAPEWRRQGIGRRVLLRLVDRARVLGWEHLHVREVYAGNDAALRLLTGIGFVPRATPPPALSLRLSPLGSRPRP
jgi:GNAT superfamily N-acetyltransferase